MAVRSSMSLFPNDKIVLKESCVPWGLTVTPFSAKDENGKSPIYGPNGNLLPRCKKCYAYFSSRYCFLSENSEWFCCFCVTRNRLSSELYAKYTSSQSCAEVTSPFIDLEQPLEGSEMLHARPVYVALVDLSSSEEFLELTISALQAALEALAPESLFGLATFSRKLGLYDVQGPIPVVKNVFIPKDTEGTLPIGLEEIMPLLQFLAPVEACKDQITSALETLKPTTSWERAPETGQGLDGILMGGRGFGAAMEALCSYLGSEYRNTFALARVLAFLSGPPDYGPGKLDTRGYGEQNASRGEDADRALLTEQAPFYKHLAAMAIHAGVCVDIFAFMNEYLNLASIRCLNIESGGSLFLYPNIEGSTLPQDIYRKLCRPYAFNCSLRLRTSTEFKPDHSYGHFFPDPEYENVQHIFCCDSNATYAYDLDFANKIGFSRSHEAIVQIAFQYTVLVPSEELSGSQLVSSSRGKHSLQRRLRIRTLGYKAAENLEELYCRVDHEVVLSLLVHKVISASLEQGVREARMFLHDWLVILTAQTFGRKRIRDEMEAVFFQYQQLEPLPQMVFALLRNPLLRFHEEGVHPDYRIYLQCLFSALEPSSLRRAIFPALTSYVTPDEEGFTEWWWHDFSRAALKIYDGPIILLDAYTTLIVFYSYTADRSTPFPPPQDCRLRSEIYKLKQERPITPKVLFVREGPQDDATLFDEHLFEEEGFRFFRIDMARNALKYIKESDTKGK